ncbi:MAG TPA: AMP-binding protein, partial [Spirillospora sp.]|nr:AMP-binding protein [Spirillospora sp.]
MDQLLPDLVARRVRSAPGAAAVAEGTRTLSYAELSDRADRLAARLRALGAGPGAFVAVRMRRRFGLVTALLAVWRAGAAYVPIDPSHPAERVRAVLDDAGAAVLVTEDPPDGVPHGAAVLLPVGP